MKLSRFRRADHRTPGEDGGAASTGLAKQHSKSGKTKYGGLDVPDSKRLKSLEDKNTKLKKPLAKAMLDNAMLKEIASTNDDVRS